jgi:hypothetical protein
VGVATDEQVNKVERELENLKLHDTKILNNVKTQFAFLNQASVTIKRHDKMLSKTTVARALLYSVQ